MTTIATLALIWSLAGAIFFVPAIPIAIVAGLFGLDLYRQVTDKRPMSVRIHEYCVKENGPYDEAAINRCKFRVTTRQLDAALDRIQRSNAR